MEDELDVWHANASGAFLSAYCALISGSGLVPDTEAEFLRCLRIFVVAKAVYQVGYELEHEAIDPMLVTAHQFIESIQIPPPGLPSQDFIRFIGECLQHADRFEA